MEKVYKKTLKQLKSENFAIKICAKKIKIVQKQAKMTKTAKICNQKLLRTACKNQNLAQLRNISTDGIRGVRTFFHLCFLVLFGTTDYYRILLATISY